jgi:hypothetical protein
MLFAAAGREWTVGYGRRHRVGRRRPPLVERHRNGGWHQVGSPTPDSSGSFLTGVVAFSQARAAAVGYRTPAGFRTIALIYR